MPTWWSRSYYAGSVGQVSQSTVKKYIANQKGSLMRKTCKYRLYPNPAQQELLRVATVRSLPSI